MTLDSRISSWLLKNSKNLFAFRYTRQSLPIIQCHYAANSTKNSNILVVILSDGQYWIPALMDAKKIKESLEIPQLENHLIKLVGMVLNISKAMFAVHRRGDVLSPHLLIQDYELAELKKTTEQTAPKEIHSHPDIKLWLTELQNTMPDLEQASIEELYPSKGRKDIDGFLKQYESIAIGFEYLMLFYYNEIVEPNLKRSNNMEEIQGWRERLKTSAKKRKLATWDILNSRRDAWANERNRMLGQRYLDYEQGDLLSEKEFLLDPEPEQPDIPKESAIKNEPSNDTCNSRLEEMEGAGSFDFDHI